MQWPRHKISVSATARLDPLFPHIQLTLVHLARSFFSLFHAAVQSSGKGQPSPVYSYRHT